MRLVKCLIGFDYDRKNYQGNGIRNWIKKEKLIFPSFVIQVYFSLKVFKRLFMIPMFLVYTCDN